jgi:lysozyme
MATYPGLSPRLNAFLNLIAFSEGTLGIPSDDGYNVLVGGGLFHNYDDHPRILVFIERLDVYSTAAGRYQIIERFFDVYKNELDLPDFGKVSQDLIAIQMLKEVGAIHHIDEGDIEQAIYLASARWASFPARRDDRKGEYGQGAHSIDGLISVYKTFL